MKVTHVLGVLALLVAHVAHAQAETGTKLCDQHPVANEAIPGEIASTEAFETGGADCDGEFRDRDHGVGAVTRLGRQWCTGVLVHEQVVLTAAHCVHNVDYTEFEFWLGPDGSTPYRTVKVIDGHVHDDYNARIVGANDIAVLFLAEPLRGVKPLRIRKERVADTRQQLMFIGYGNLNRPTPGVKRCLFLPVKSICAKSFSYGEKGRQPCHGDSGGPALLSVGGAYEVAGITSWGDSDCRRHGVSMDVGAYRDYVVARIAEVKERTDRPPPAMEAWPRGLPEGGELVVGRGDAMRDIGRLSIPKNATIRFAPDVEYVSWAVGTLEFGEGATIDLSAPVDSGGTPHAPPIEGQLPHGVAGAAGLAGGMGREGRPGRTFSMQVRAGRPFSGSLWIRTDGAPGTPGGNGGKGQRGGTSSCGKCLGLGPDEPKTNGGRGGAGGQGGSGGFGGDTSQVHLNLPVYSLARCRPACGVSTRPDLANGNDGRIVVFGAPGCGGAAGAGGRGESGGDRNRSCPCGADVISGEKGPDGAPGTEGQPGVCGELVEVQSAP